MYKASFTASLDQLEEVREFVLKIISNEKLKLDEEEQLQILLAVDEAFTNSIKHAYQFDEHKIIEVRIQLTSRKLIISVIDFGPGFKPRKPSKNDIIQRIKKLKPGGLGIYIMETVMDEVHFNINPGKKNEVKMVKYLHGK